jgi:hypothetical protein
MHPRIRAECVDGQQAAESASNLELNNVIIIQDPAEIPDDF